MRGIEPGISRFPDAQLRIWGLVLTHHPGMTAKTYGLKIAAPVVALPSSSVCALAASFSA